MSDLDPFTHGEEGTHYLCSERIGGLETNPLIRCCGCVGHDCEKKKEETPPVERLEDVDTIHYDKPISVDFKEPTKEAWEERIEKCYLSAITSPNGIPNVTVNPDTVKNVVQSLLASERARIRGKCEGHVRFDGDWAPKTI